MTQSLRVVVPLLSCLLLPSLSLAATGEVVQSIPAPGYLTSGIGWDGTSLWVTNMRSSTAGGEDRVYQIDPLDGAVAYWFDMPNNDFYHGIDFDDKGTMYTDDLYSKIVILDEQGFETDRFNAQGMTYGVAYAASTDTLLQLDWLADETTLYELHPQTGALIRSVELAITEQQTQDTAWDGTALWVVGSSDTVYRVDIVSGAVMDSFIAPGNPSGIAFDGSCLWISENNADELLRVDHGQSDLPACGEEPDPTDPEDDVTPDPSDPPDDGTPDEPDPETPPQDGDGDDDGMGSESAGGCAVGGTSQGVVALLLLTFLVCMRRRRSN